MVDLSDLEMKQFESRARAIRITIIEMLAEAKSGHLAGPLGMTDIFTALYFHILKHAPKNPIWEDRDRLFLSNGHICPVLYATMAHAGYFPIEECMTLRTFGSRLQGHPEREKLAGLESTSRPPGTRPRRAAGSRSGIFPYRRVHDFAHIRLAPPRTPRAREAGRSRINVRPPRERTVASCWLRIRRENGQTGLPRILRDLRRRARRGKYVGRRDVCGQVSPE